MLDAGFPVRWPMESARWSVATVVPGSVLGNCRHCASCSHSRSVWSVWSVSERMELAGDGRVLDRRAESASGEEPVSHLSRRVTPVPTIAKLIQVAQEMSLA